MVEVGWIEMPEDINHNMSWTLSGGDSYRKYLFDVLSENYNLEGMGFSGGILSRHIFKNFYRSFKYCRKKDIIIGEIDSSILPHIHISMRNLFLFFHIGGAVPTSYTIPNILFKQIFYNKLKKFDIIIVIAKYWKEYFENLGFDNVILIYNPFDMNQFQFGENEIDQFKYKHNLISKPIIYLGNCQKWKGVVESYHALKDLDAYLVTSGKRSVNIPSMNLNLSYRDYLLLLRSSSVAVTMSMFPEGWCRTAHEAMLCKTPVVGSGLGGMGELLGGGKQITCKNFNNLINDVEYAMEHPELGQEGYNFACQTQFTKKYFNNKWINLIESMVD